VMVLIAMPQQYKERFLSIGGQEAEGASKDARLEIMRDAWEVMQTDPFGVGVNSFMKVRMQRFGRIQDTHNLYLQVGTHLGFHGLVAFLFFVGAMVVSFHRRAALLDRARGALGRDVQRRRAPPAVRREQLSLYGDIRFIEAMARASRMYVLMLLVNGIFAHTLYLICWWFLAGLAIVLANISSDLARDARRIVVREDDDDGGGEATGGLDAGGRRGALA